MVLIAASAPLQLVWLALLLAGFAGVLSWLGRRARAADPRALETIRLGPQHSAVVMVIDNRRLLVGIGPGAAPQLLCELDNGMKSERESGRTTDSPRVAAGAATASRERGGWDLGG